MAELSIIPILADSDIIGTVVVVVIIGAISLIQKLIESFKKKQEQNQPTTYDDDYWDEGDMTSHERRIRDIIKSLGGEVEEETPQLPPARTTLQKQQVEQPVAAMVQAPPPVQTVFEQAAASMEKVVDPLSQLSDAEKQALARLQSQDKRPATAAAKVRHISYRGGAVSSATLQDGLANPEMLRNAILYHEVLGKPVALRDA